MWKIYLILLVSFWSFAACESTTRSIRTRQYQRKRNLYKPLIVNGEPARIEEFPHILALIDHNTFICGASIISLEWALTAAHCVEAGSKPQFLKLYGGSTNRMSGGIQFDVERYRIHPDYDWQTLDYDVAVIKTSTQFTGPNIRPTLIADEFCYTGARTNLRVAGWGLNDKLELPEYLMQIKQYTISTAECTKHWGNDITDRMICVSTKLGSDSCDGDSGGPALHAFLQVGIISFGSLVCGDGKTPAVFARIEERGIRNFIRTHTKV